MNKGGGKRSRASDHLWLIAPAFIAFLRPRWPAVEGRGLRGGGRGTYSASERMEMLEAGLGRNDF